MPFFFRFEQNIKLPAIICFVLETFLIMLFRTGNSSPISLHKEYRLASSELFVYPPILL